MFRKLALIFAVLGTCVLTTGCAGVIWNSSFYETATVGDADKMMSDVGAKEVAKYTTFLGYNMGLDTYRGLVSAELRKGNRTYHVVRKNYYIYSQTIGYIVEK